MEKEKFKNLSELVGKHVKVEENLKSTQKKEERFFLELMESMCQIEAVSAVLGTIGVNVEKYDNPYVRSMRMMMEKCYGEMKTEVILWWVFDSITPDGDIYPLLDENNQKHVLRTPLQLYKFLKRYDGK